MRGNATQDLIDDLHESGELDKSWDRVLRFMIASCDLIATSVPPVAAEGIETAKRYLAGQATAGVLEQARSRCWRYLDEFPERDHPADPRVNAVRAVICLLHPHEDRGPAIDLLDFFVDHIQYVAGVANVADSDIVQRELLRREFPMTQ